MKKQSVQIYSSAFLKTYCRHVFMHYGVSEEDAEQAADVLAAADLRGIESHGVARLHTYVDLLSTGRINPQPKIKVIRESPSTATVDGDNGLGLIIATKANRIAMDKGKSNGTGWVSVCNTNNFGIAGYYVLKALKEDLIGWAMTNTSKLVAPTFGAERILGTNPIAIAFPGLKEPPIVIDMATSTVTYGKIEMAKRKGESIPDGWAIDNKGNVCTDPKAMMEGGALSPIGAQQKNDGHKGYCLGLMVDVLSSVLSGANWGPFAPPFAVQQSMSERSVGKGIGHFFGAMRIDAFIDVNEFKRQIDDYIQVLRTTKPLDESQRIIIPGDLERQNEILRRKQGIPLILPVIESLRDISKMTGIPFD